jgi:diguanylate cyclase
MDAYTCAERVREMVTEITYPGLPEDFRVTISMGLTRYQPSETIDALVIRADDALYRAKRTGKNTIVCEPSVFLNITKAQCSAA